MKSILQTTSQLISPCYPLFFQVQKLLPGKSLQPLGVWCLIHIQPPREKCLAVHLVAKTITWFLLKICQSFLLIQVLKGILNIWYWFYIGYLSAVGSLCCFFSLIWLLFWIFGWLTWMFVECLYFYPFTQTKVRLSADLT